MMSVLIVLGGWLVFGALYVLAEPDGLLRFKAAVVANWHGVVRLVRLLKL